MGGVKPYPIGYLEYDGHDVEIEFLHYKSEDEAREKWTRRCKRINWDDLLVVGSEVDECTKEDVENFVSLPYERKYFFVRNKYDDVMSDCIYHVPEMNRKSFTNLHAQAQLLFVRMVTSNKLAIRLGGLL